MAGKMCGYPVHVVMPEGTIPAKKQAVLDMGAKVTSCFNSEQVMKSIMIEESSQHLKLFL